MGRAGGRKTEGGPAKSVVVSQIMRITSHGFSSMSAGSRYAKIYNVLTFGSTEAQLASVQLRSIPFSSSRSGKSTAEETGKEVGEFSST